MCCRFARRLPHGPCPSPERGSAAGLAAFSAYRSAGRQTVRDPADASGRARRLTAPGLVVLVVAAAALTVWQLRLYGSPVTPSSDGGSAVDPIAVVAPALALIAVVLLVVLVFPLLAGLGDRISLRQRVTAQLAARTVARRVSLAAAPLVVVALATGSTVVAAVYSATWTIVVRRDERAARRGGPARHLPARGDRADGGRRCRRPSGRRARRADRGAAALARRGVRIDRGREPGCGRAGRHHGIRHLRPGRRGRGRARRPAGAGDHRQTPGGSSSRCSSRTSSPLRASASGSWTGWGHCGSCRSIAVPDEQCRETGVATVVTTGPTCRPSLAAAPAPWRVLSMDSRSPPVGGRRSRHVRPPRHDAR